VWGVGGASAKYPPAKQPVRSFLGTGSCIRYTKILLDLKQFLKGNQDINTVKRQKGLLIKCIRNGYLKEMIFFLSIKILYKFTRAET
jgi:hypothetical protein